MCKISTTVISRGSSTLDYFRDWKVWFLWKCKSTRTVCMWQSPEEGSDPHPTPTPAAGVTGSISHWWDLWLLLLSGYCESYNFGLIDLSLRSCFQLLRACIQMWLLTHVVKVGLTFWGPSILSPCLPLPSLFLPTLLYCNTEMKHKTYPCYLDWTKLGMLLPCWPNMLLNDLTQSINFYFQFL